RRILWVAFMGLFFLGPDVLGQLGDAFGDVPAPASGIFLDLELFLFLCGIGQVLLQGHLGAVNFGEDASQADKNFLVGAGRIIGPVDGKHQRLFFLGEAQQLLNAVEVLQVLALVQQDLAVGVVDDRLL